MISRLSLTLVMLLFAGTAMGQDTPAKTSKNLIDVPKTVMEHFRSLDFYSTGDMITDQQVAPLFNKFEKLGWKIDDQEQILQKFVSTGSFLDQVMNSSRGKVFFRNISGFDRGMDQVERISVMKNGRSSIRQLVFAMPRGSDYIRAVATSKHGKILARLVRQSPNGQFFNQPTGKIYTEEELVHYFYSLYQIYLKEKSKTIKNKFA